MLYAVALKDRIMSLACSSVCLLNAAELTWKQNDTENQILMPE